MNNSPCLKGIAIHVLLLTGFIGVTWAHRNHTRFKCTTQQNITCTLHCAPITPSKEDSFSPLLPCFVYLHLPSPPCPPTLATLCPWAMHTCSLANPFTFFHLASPTHSPPIAVSLFHVSMPLFQCCLSVYIFTRFLI